MDAARQSLADIEAGVVKMSETLRADGRAFDKINGTLDYLRDNCCTLPRKDARDVMLMMAIVWPAMLAASESDFDGARWQADFERTAAEIDALSSRDLTGVLRYSIEEIRQASTNDAAAAPVYAPRFHRPAAETAVAAPALPVADPAPAEAAVAEPEAAEPKVARKKRRARN